MPSRQHARQSERRSRILEFTVPDMVNDRSSARIAASLNRVAETTAIVIDPSQLRVTVQFDPKSTGLAKLVAAIEESGSAVADISEPGVRGSTRELHLIVPAMTCEHYAGIVGRSLQRLPGIIAVSFDLLPRRVSVRFDPIKAEVQMVKAAVERAGFEASEEPQRATFRRRANTSTGRASNKAA